ncbi:PAS domain S-box protein [Methanolacinia paynteri]|uniref:PAS domain S-box protein n=1 Tax=Methanolacinia paynteri TaxID=230356 RepID=UPI0006950A13|nr:PAS domain S-box protein [Methanolacinia paynteri]
MELSYKNLLRLFEIQFAFFMICDKEGRIQYANSRCEKLGIIREKAGGDKPQELYPEKTSDSIRTIALSTIKSGKVVRTDISLPIPGGERWYEITATPVYDKSIESVAVMMTGRDITECRVTGERLSNSKLQIDILLDGSPVPMFILNEDHRLIYWNKALERQSGIKAGDVLGTKSQWKIFYSKKRPTLADVLLDNSLDDLGKWYPDLPRQSEDIPGAYEIDNYYPDLGPGGKWLKLIASALKDDGGRTYGAIETYIDITEKKKAELALKESEEKFREVFNNANDMIILTYFDEKHPGRIIEVNERVVMDLGYQKSELIDMDPLMLVDESDREKSGEILNKIATVPGFLYELLLKTKEGGEIAVEIKTKAFELGGQQVALSVMRDITERNKARDIEKRAFTQIEENITQLATLGDAIRNPLAVIVGLADLNGGELGEKIKREAREIDDYITILDRGWIESEKVRYFLKRHYGI